MSFNNMVKKEMNTGSVILNSGFNEFCRNFLVKGNPVAAAEVSLFERRHDDIIASLCEQLLLFDKVSFKVYGENIPLAVLFNHLGVKNLEQLVEEEAIEFVLWTPLLTYTLTDIPGLLPLQSGSLTSPVHSNPDESIKLGFEWLAQAKRPKRDVRRALQNRIRKLYKVPEDHFSRNAANLVIDAYKSNKLAKFGMPNDWDIVRLPVDQRKRLCDFADSVLETTILSQFGYSSFQKYENFVLSTSTFARIQAALQMKENIGKVCEIEHIPDLKSLFLDKKLDISSLLKLRSKSDSIKFRKWLHAVSTDQDAKDITKEYIDSLVDSKGFFETRKGKLVKTLSLYSLSVGVGSLVAGIPGTLIGGSLAKMIEPAADLGLDLIDTYYLDGMLRGWNPRLFIDKLRNTISDSDNYLKNKDSK